MNDSTLFNSDRFLRLSGSELVSYVEPFVNTQMQAIPESAYDVLRDSLDRLDEIHTVYALEICMLLKPNEFIHRALTYLSHSNGAVCCAAYNSINRLTSTQMSNNLVQEIAATPIVDLFAAEIHSGKRIRIGTNQEFIRDLVTKFMEK